MNSILLISHLLAKFGGCKFEYTTQCVIKRPILYTDNPQFFVHDNNPVNIIENKTNKTVYDLEVLNSIKKTVCLIKVDKCLFSDRDDFKKCDCVLFNYKSLFFVELKSSAQGNKGTKRTQAAKQLLSTIEKFKEAGNYIATKKCYAVICFRKPENKITQASANSLKEKFNTYDIKLVEGNKIEFS